MHCKIKMQIESSKHYSRTSQFHIMQRKLEIRGLGGKCKGSLR